MTIFVEVKTKGEKSKQNTECKNLIKSWVANDKSKEALRDKLVVMFGDFLKDDKDSKKEYDFAVKQFLAAVGYDDIKSLCEGKGINIRAEFSAMAKVSSLLVDCKTMKDVRRAYDADRKARSAAKGGKPSTGGKQSTGDSAPDAAADPVESKTTIHTGLSHPNMAAETLEFFNQFSSTVEKADQIALIELFKRVILETEAKKAEALKIVKAA